MSLRCGSLLILVFLCVTGLKNAVAQRLPDIEKTIPVLDSLYKNYSEKIKSPGFVYGIVGNGELLHAGGFGFGNIDKKYVADKTTAFRIASMSKSFTAMAILQLRDRGKLRLDDPASLYIAELRNIKYPFADAPQITIRHLLTHSAGFPEDNPWGDRQLDVSDKEMLEMFRKGISFSNDPGAAYEYSNMGFAMLGYIIGKVSGQPYQKFIEKNIFQPLRMANTYWEYSKVPEKKLALGYRFVNGQHVFEPSLHDGAYGAMGGLITTIEDFAKYMALHLAAWSESGDSVIFSILKRSSLREMQKMQQFDALNNGDSVGKCPFVSGYGYGLRWTKNCKGRESVGHSGGLPGFGSNWVMLPQYGFGVVCFANITYAPTSAINSRAIDTLISLNSLKPAEVPVSPILDQRQEQLLKLLPHWKDAEKSGIFAENFFSDYFLDSLKKEAADIFRKAGRIKRAGPMIPLNNLRGSCILEGEKENVEVWFTLSPENPPLIQEYEIKNVPK